MLTITVAGLAAWCGTTSGGAVRRLAPVKAKARRRWLSQAPAGTAGGVTVLALLLVLGPARGGWALAGGLVVGAILALWLGKRARDAAGHRAAAVASAARSLSALLRAGQIPQTALTAAAGDAPILARAAAAAEVGGDVAAALSADAALPGADGLRAMASAWRISERTGAPVASVLGVVADQLRRQRRVAGVVEAELASARASGNIMAALPLGAVGLGFFAGVDSIGFLLGHPAGQWLVAVAVGLTALGVWWIERLARA